MSSKYLKHLFEVLILVLLFSSPQATLPAGLIEATARKSAPDFSLLDASGSIVKLSDYKGKVVLLDFWATYCGVCKKEIPWYVQFEKQFKSRGFAAVGVSMDTSWGAIRPFMAEEKMNYPVVIGSWGLLGRFGLHVQALPITLLIDRGGRIADYHIGVVNKDQFEGEIKKLLTEKGS